ncbi:PREDICTED: uncharacterized protein LOC109310694 [Crocodylus porosus]|uniref:uncharacterized protein LOC109310694 n=1 Tax=Crocodylus porosus TaxID=8502 RepID=UPI00093B3753|nr:PREDICTED: uncharacterized protein LOC109310694 [Crocodylus porosus]
MPAGFESIGRCCQQVLPILARSLHGLFCVPLTLTTCSLVRPATFSVLPPMPWTSLPAFAGHFPPPDIRLARWRCGEAANTKRCSTASGPTSQRGYIKRRLRHVRYSTQPTARGRVVPMSLETHGARMVMLLSRDRASGTRQGPRAESSGRQLNFCCDFGGFGEIPSDGCPSAGRSGNPASLLPSSVLNFVASVLAPAACCVGAGPGQISEVPEFCYKAPVSVLNPPKYAKTYPLPFFFLLNRWDSPSHPFLSKCLAAINRSRQGTTITLLLAQLGAHLEITQGIAAKTVIRSGKIQVKDPRSAAQDTGGANVPFLSAMCQERTDAAGTTRPAARRRHTCLHAVL